MATKTDAEAIRAKLREQVRSIRDDAGLLPDGRVERLRAVYRTARDAMQSLRAGEVAGRTGDLESATRALFPLPSSPEGRISVRDALDRVESLSRLEDARSLLDRAARSGDSDLARAVLQRALDMRWRPVVARYLEAFPADGPKLDAYLEASSSASSRRSPLDSMLFSLERPAELGGDW